MANDWCSCPDICTGVLTLKTLPVDQDCIAWLPLKSQVCGIVLAPAAAGVPVDWTLAPDWATFIDNTDVLNANGKYLVGIGGIPAAEKTVTPFPKAQERVTNREYTLTFNVPNLPEETYDFLIDLQCGDASLQMWYQSVGGWIYGGPDGIDLKSIDVDFPKGEGAEDFDQAVITMTFDACSDPPRTADVWP